MYFFGKKRNKNLVEKKKLSPEATILLTVVATLGTIVLARLMYFIITGA